MPITSVGLFGSKRVDPNSKTPYSDATQCRKKKPDRKSHVRRPMNAFMVYAQLERNRMLELRPGLHNAEISKTLGRKWTLMSDDEKRPFVEEAALLKAMHLLEFPEYKYRPKKRGRPAATIRPKGGLLRPNDRSSRRRSNSRDGFLMAKAVRNNEDATAAGDDLLDADALVPETSSCCNVDRSKYAFCRLNEPFLSPGFNCSYSSWTGNSKDTLTTIRRQSTGVDSEPVADNLCEELIEEDNTYSFRLLTPNAESSSEQQLGPSQQMPSANSTDLQIKSEDVGYDHNNNLFFANFHPESAISNAESFRDTAAEERDELSDDAFFTDLHSSNVGQDALLDFIDDYSLALYPYEYMTYFPEIPDTNDFLDPNPDFSGICKTN